MFLTRFDRVIFDDAEHLVCLINSFDPASTDTPIIEVVCSLRGARKWLITYSPLRISDFPKFFGFFEIPKVIEFCSLNYGATKGFQSARRGDFKIPYLLEKTGLLKDRFFLQSPMEGFGPKIFSVPSCSPKTC